VSAGGGRPEAARSALTAQAWYGGAATFNKAWYFTGADKQAGKQRYFLKDPPPPPFYCSVSPPKLSPEGGSFTAAEDVEL
jgi:hypothetical protein